MSNASYNLSFSGTEIDEILTRAAPSGTVPGTIDHHIGELYRSIASINAALGARISAVEATAATNAENIDDTAEALANVNSVLTSQIAALDLRVHDLEQIASSTTYDGVPVRELTMMNLTLDDLQDGVPVTLHSGLNDVSRLALYSSAAQSETWTEGGYTGTTTVWAVGSSIAMSQGSPITIFDSHIQFDHGGNVEMRECRVTVTLSGTDIILLRSDVSYPSPSVEPWGSMIFYAINDF